MVKASAMNEQLNELLKAISGLRTKLTDKIDKGPEFMEELKQEVNEKQDKSQKRMEELMKKLTNGKRA